MTVLLQVSDPHFGTERPAVLAALLELSRQHRPTVLVVSGDVTQRARRRQFEAARRFVARVAATATVVIPGNHDIPLFNLWARAFAPYRGFVHAFGVDLEPVVSTEHWLVVGVNTTRAHRHVDGEVCRTQVMRVASRLRSAAAAQVRVVVVHQPAQVVRREDQQNLLHGRDRALREWEAAGVDIVMGGHIHLPYVHPLRAADAGPARQPWVVQAGTAVSSRTRDGVPNSVNLLRYRRDDDGRRQCLVERWDYSNAAGQFEIHAEHALQFDVAAAFAHERDRPSATQQLLGARSSAAPADGDSSVGRV